MQLWPFARDTQQSLMQQQECLLDEHACALLAGDWQTAHFLRQQQTGEMAELMQLAEELAVAYRPMSLKQSTREWLLHIVMQGLPESRRQRIAAAVRGHGKEAVLGAALVGTAFSLGKVAIYFYRKRHHEDAISYQPSVM